MVQECSLVADGQPKLQLSKNCDVLGDPEQTEAQDSNNVGEARTASDAELQPAVAQDHTQEMQLNY